jgi:hypothetical protein
MNDPKRDAAKLALTVLQRFVGPQPDALERVRDQVRGELAAAEGQAARLRAELDALETLLDMSEEEAREAAVVPRIQTSLRLYPPMPLRRAILTVLGSRHGYWSRDELLDELVRRGWAPGGSNPRNTLISRLSEMAKDGLIVRMDDGFGISLDDEGVPAM